MISSSAAIYFKSQYGNDIILELELRDYLGVVFIWRLIVCCVQLEVRIFAANVVLMQQNMREREREKEGEREREREGGVCARERVGVEVWGREREAKINVNADEPTTVLFCIREY